MRTLFALLLTTVSLAAQNIEVKFFYQVTNEMTLRGAPSNAIAVVRGLGTNTAPHAGWTYIGTASDLKLVDAVNRPQMDAWLKTNWAPYIEAQKIAAIGTVRTNKTQLGTLFEKFADYEALCQTNTPSNAQVALEVRRLNGALLLLKQLSQ